MKIAVQFVDYTAATINTFGESVTLRDRDGHTDIISADDGCIIGVLYDTVNAEVSA